MTRGILYLAWGDKIEPMLQRSIASANAVHPELPVDVRRLPAESTLLDKARMFEFSKFDTTLYLDADTVVLGRMDYAFDAAERFGLACSVCECPWLRRYEAVGALGNDVVGDTPEYNTGVMCFSRGWKVVFDLWKDYAANMDSSISWTRGDGSPDRMPANDQMGFALAVHAKGANPHVLPLNFNFRPAWHRRWFGPVKVWHDYKDVPSGVRGAVDAPAMKLFELMGHQ